MLDVSIEEIAKKHGLSENESHLLLQMEVNQLARVSGSLLAQHPDMSPSEVREYRREISEREKEMENFLSALSSKALGVWKDYLRKTIEFIDQQIDQQEDEQ